MKNLARLPLILAVSSALALGCTKKAEAPQTKTQKKKVTTKAQAKPEKGPVCVTPWTTKGPVNKFSYAGFEISSQGTQLNAKSAKPDKEFTFGVIADIKENTPENQVNIKKILEHFAANKVEAIVVPGDLGDTQVQIEEALTMIGEAKLPILSLIGNREGRTAYANAIKTSKASNPGLIDLNQHRLVTFDDVAFISVPGYHNKIYIHARDGCHYTPEDVEATRAIAKAAEAKTRFLVSHGPPRQKGPKALDRTLEEANVGDPELQNFLRETNIPFGIFANIHEAGGRATDQSGENIIQANQFASSLYLNPGPADAVRWAMNDGTESVGMAAVVNVKGVEAKYSIFRIPLPDDSAQTATPSATP